MAGLDDYLNPQDWVRMGLGPYTALPQQQPANPYAGSGLEQFRASQGAAPVTTMPGAAPTTLLDAIAQHMVTSPFQAMQRAQQSAANLQAGFPAASTDVPNYDPGGPVSIAQLMFGRMPFAGRGMAGAGGGRLTQPSAFRDAPNPNAPFPQFAEETVWHGAKDASGEPMIQTVNKAIERTHRLTGMPRSEIVQRAWGAGNIPIYGLGGLMGLGVTGQALQQK